VSVLVDPQDNLKGTVVMHTALSLPIKEVPFDVVQGAGEYEIEGITVRGFQLENESDATTLKTAYYAKFDDIQLAFFEQIAGAIPEKVLDKIGEIDVLFISIGEGYLSVSDALACVKQLTPKMVIPLWKKKEDIQAFADELGAHPEPIDKVVVKKRDLNDEGTTFIWMNEK
jgi:L-ascorbate metabolism protein UlaG (beta-lactamase superfamily)